MKLATQPPPYVVVRSEFYVKVEAPASAGEALEVRLEPATREDEMAEGTVSYTHLTLPTICSV